MFYLDTSAAMKLIIDEVETKELRKFISVKKATFISAEIIDLELIRTLMKNYPSAVGQGLIFLDRIAKIEVNSDLVRGAINLSPDLRLRALDALHVAACHRVRRAVEGLVTYDLEMAEAAETLGLTVFAPGAKQK